MCVNVCSTHMLVIANKDCFKQNHLFIVDENILTRNASPFGCGFSDIKFIADIQRC